MEAVVEYRCLSDKLSNTEHSLFIKQLLTKYDERHFMDTLITHLLINQVKNNKNHYHNHITKMIKNIINERQKNEFSNINKKIIIDSALSTHKVNIEDLSPPLISNCASYLPSNDIFKFQRCNRYIYTSSVNTPTTFTNLMGKSWRQLMATYGWNQYHDHKNQLIYKRYRRLNVVAVNAASFHNVHRVCNDIWKWKNLKALCINNLVTEHQTIIEFMNIFTKYLKNTNIESIALTQCQSPDITKIMKFLSNNINIKYLTFSQMILRNFNRMNDFFVFKQFTKLKGLDFQRIDGRIIDNILSQINDQLEILRILNCNNNIPLSLNIDFVFPKLKEIIIGDYDVECIVNIINHCNIDNLEKVQFVRVFHNAVRYGMIKLFDKIVGCRKLKYLRLSSCVDIELLLKQIEIALAKCDEKVLYLWKDLKVMISLRDRKDIDYVANNCEYLVDLMDKAIDNDWLLILSIHEWDKWEEQIAKIKTICNEWKNKKRFIVNYNFKNYYYFNLENARFCISNINNKMCGYWPDHIWSKLYCN